MKLPLKKPSRSAGLALFLSYSLSVGFLGGQPAAAPLPSGYTHLQTPPPGYGTQATGRSAAPVYPQNYPQPQQPMVWPPGTPPPGSLPNVPATTTRPPTSATAKSKTATTAPKKSSSKTTSSSKSTNTSPKDREQDKRITKLEGDVDGIRRNSAARYSGGESSSSGARGSYVVKPGDSLSEVALMHRVSPSEIKSLNRMKSDTVLVGQLLLIPGRGGSSSSSVTKASYKSHDYVVRPGDSLKAIAIRNGTSTATLISLNRIKNPDMLVVGQRLALPGGKPVTSTSRSTSTPRSSSSKAPVASFASASDDTVPLPGVTLPNDPPLEPAKPKAPLYPSSTTSKTTSSSGSTAVNKTADTHRGILAYRVDKTDTIESIAAQFSTTPDRIRQMNHLQPSTKLENGDEIMVPALGAVSVN